MRSAAPFEAPTSVPEPGKVAAPDEDRDHETEAQMLRRAQVALGGDPSRALQITDEHARRFGGGGVLAEEREILAISALAALGRADEARDRAVRVVRQHPASAYRRKLEALVPGLREFVSKH